jgi:hypothetical protein
VVHRLRKRADMAAELVRLLRDDLAAALAELAAKGPLEQRIHSVRQLLKWVRSTLRVLEGAFAEEATAARRQAAETARLLASARDADVAAASARVLSATTTAAADAGFDRLADRLDQEAAAAHRKHAPLAEVHRRLRAIAETASRFPTDFDGEALLNAALKRAYHRGRRAMKQAAFSRGTGDLHRWRKDAKHLWHLVRMVRSMLPKQANKLADGLDKLTELLGLDHDHAMLADRLALSPHQRSLNRQLSLISERRASLEQEAFARGAKLYAKKPRAFAERFRVKAVSAQKV